MFTYKINSERVLSESDNMVVKLCNINWGENPESIDIRKWRIKMNNDDIEYIPNKGISLSKEVASDLADSLVEDGICNDSKIARILENRHNIKIDIPDDNDYNESSEYINPLNILNDV